MAVVKRYKFQAVVSLHAAGDGQPCPELGPAPHRMVLLGRSDETGRSQLFTVLISCEDDGPLRPGSPLAEVTLRVAGDDVPDYLGIGRQFGLWLGGEVGEGVVTRRLFV
jgi:hypothetical protein